MRKPIAALTLGVVVLAGCTVPENSQSTSTGSSIPATAPPTTATAAGPAVQVTVPALSGADTVISSAPASSEVSVVSQAPVQTVAVDPAGCGGCTQLASHKDVREGLSAVLVTVKGRAALLSIDGSGAIKQVANVPYGSTFPAPPNGVLPCDSAGRCLVIGRTTEGKAIGSAFQLGAGGGWTDVSATGGFQSATDRGQVVDLDGEPGIAVQATGSGRTVWSVYAWGGSDGYQLVGCVPDGPLNLDQLSPESCIS